MVLLHRATAPCIWKPAQGHDVGAIARRKYRVALLIGCAVLLVLGMAPTKAEALVAGQPLSSGFPRLGVQWPDPKVQSLDDIARYDYVLLQPVFRGYVPLIKAKNPNTIIMTSTNPCEIGLDTSATPAPGANAAISRVPNAWIQTQLGSRLSAAVDADDTVFRLPNTSRFRVDDVLVVDDELAKVISVGPSSLTVQRGLLPERSSAAPMRPTRELRPS